MRMRRGGVAAALLGAQLAACAPITPPASPGAEKPAVELREDLSRRFIAVIGLKARDDPPYLGISDTNFSCLRSFFDRRTGETAHQLYVAASYDRKRDWNAAHDGASQMLDFIPISRLEIACDGKNNCSYAEEFAAKLPEGELNENHGGFSVTFTDRVGNSQTVAVSADQIAAQLGALAELQKHAPPTAAAAASQRSDQKP